tara:strand:- start:2325 stop:2987 length:663 start_codon:yes stop_codon:yes gene_type:complete
MALRLYPFRQYSDHDVINMYANQVVDDNPTTNGNGSAGVMVKVLSGNMQKDTFDLIGSTYLGKTDYPFLGADKYPVVPLRVVAATTGSPVLGVTLNQTLKNDENGEKLLYNPVKKDELQAVLSGQAVPVATKGLFTFDETAYEKDSNFVPGNIAAISANDGKLTGVTRESLADVVGTLVGHIIGTGNRTSQMGKSDEFAGTGTAQYALVHLDVCASWDVA